MSNMAKDERQLYNLIANSLNVQIGFRHKDFFGNNHIVSIFTNTGLLNKFQNLLIKIERNEKPEYEDGTVLRNMIEIIVADISKNEEITVREYLNHADAYSALFKRKHTAQNYKNIIAYSTVDENNVKKFLRTKLSGDKLEQEVQYVLQYATAWRLGNLSEFYKGDIPEGCPPKYIFSGIDNIYTVTSEWSSHGKNLTTTKELSLEGWKAIVFGMCQILQWVADTNP